LGIVFFALSQDKIYFLNGLSKQVTVLEINPNEVKFETDSTTETILKEEVLLIEYKNGSIEVLNKPKESKIVNTNSLQKNNTYLQNKPIFNNNLVSINTLALCNADVAVFYERILQNKRIGLGVMGAFNFNLNSTMPNIFITLLNNAKKNYDLGIYFNYYPKAFSKKTFISYGILFKQTNFSYNSILTDSTLIAGQIAVTISYKPSIGNQFATIFNIGSYTQLPSNFFIKTLFGIGGFYLTGNYKTQLNYELNKNNISNSNSAPPEPFNVRFLPKLYLGLNIGFAF